VTFYEVVKFDGSLILNYWGPYLDSHIFKIIETAFTANRELAIEHDLDPTNSVNDALIASEETIDGLLDLMADYDQRMRGKGYPENVAKKNIGDIQQRYFKIIQARAENEIALFNMPKKNTVKLPLTESHDIWWFIRNCHRSLYFKYLFFLLTVALFIFSLGFAFGRNNTVVKIYDAVKSFAIIQTTTPTTTPQNNNKNNK
jgi:hypothetical protein